MKTSDFTTNELSLIEAEAKECGFPSAERFIEIQSGQWRLAILSASDAFARQMPDAGERVAFGQKVEHDIKHKSFEGRREGSDAYSYLLFPDGSLYLDSNAEDEVWASAEDFADEHLMKLIGSKLHRTERRLLRKLGGAYKERAKALKRESRCAKWIAILEKFLASEDYLQGCVSATRAAYAGSGYSVELFRDGTWRVLPTSQIGNGYDSPGIILALPTFESAAEDTHTHEEEEAAIREAAECFAGEEKEMMREAIRAKFEQ